MLEHVIFLFDYRSSADVTIAMETTDVTFFSRANKTLASNSDNTYNKITIIISTSVVVVLGVVCFVVAVAVIIQRKKVNWKGNSKFFFISNIILRLVNVI